MPLHRRISQSLALTYSYKPEARLSSAASQKAPQTYIHAWVPLVNGIPRPRKLFLKAPEVRLHAWMVHHCAMANRRL